jgi:hypothetical protein
MGKPAESLVMADCYIGGKEMENFGIDSETRVPPIPVKQSPASFMRLRNRWGSLRSPPTYSADGHGTPCPYENPRHPAIAVALDPFCPIPLLPDRFSSDP